MYDDEEIDVEIDDETMNHQDNIDSALLDHREDFGEMRGTSQFAQRNFYDEQELEKRKKIAEDIRNVGIKKDADILFEFSINNKPEKVAFEYRVPMLHEEYATLMRTLRYTSEHVKNAFAILDSYITFSNETPSSENINNLIHNFFEFIRDEKASDFHQGWFEDEGIHYFREKWFTYYLQSISILLDRLQGLLERAAKYIVDAEMESKQGSGYDYDNGMGGFGGRSMGGFGSYGGSYGGYGGYGNNPYSHNSFDFNPRQRGGAPMNYMKFNMPQKRDFGDEGDYHKVDNEQK